MKRICTICGETGRPRRAVRGSMAVEILLWLISLPLALWSFLVLIVPVSYSLWRIVARRRLQCRSCGSAALVRTDSPRGRAMQRQLQQR